LASFFDLTKEVNKLLDQNALTTTDVENIYSHIWDFDKVLGIFAQVKQEKVPKEIQKLAAEREAARQEKNFQHADELRQKIEKLGWQIEDTPFGPRLKKQ